mmetsp:Transcript_25912/g.103596  ORF Transcript_25912/g.103596 Transcript_25912/m.103596 type:complete len:260 (+) Transcript_25912:828-1607(+)
MASGMPTGQTRIMHAAKARQRLWRCPRQSIDSSKAMTLRSSTPSPRSNLRHEKKVMTTVETLGRMTYTSSRMAYTTFEKASCRSAAVSIVARRQRITRYAPAMSPVTTNGAIVTTTMRDMKLQPTRQSKAPTSRRAMPKKFIASRTSPNTRGNRTCGRTNSVDCAICQAATTILSFVRIDLWIAFLRRADVSAVAVLTVPARRASSSVVPSSSRSSSAAPAAKVAPMSSNIVDCEPIENPARTDSFTARMAAVRWCDLP